MSIWRGHEDRVECLGSLMASFSSTIAIHRKANMRPAASVYRGVSNRNVSFATVNSRVRRAVLLLPWLLASAFVSACAQHQGEIALSNVTIIDGTDRPPLRNATVYGELAESHI